MSAASAPDAVRTPEPADAELVARVLQGERDTYGRLILRHQQALYRYCRGMQLDHDTSLDMVQDALLKSYTRLADCRTPVHFRAWLFSITRNLVLDHFKNVRRRSIPFSVLPGVKSIASGETERHELRRTLRGALHSLTPELRDAFLLKHDAGYTYEEAAGIAGVSPSAIKMRVHRAREILRDTLAHAHIGAAEVTIEPRPIVLREQ
jgi:RNA polymerase sigma-70 factor (ECF subfamily)